MTGSATYRALVLLLGGFLILLLFVLIVFHPRIDHSSLTAAQLFAVCVLFGVGVYTLSQLKSVEAFVVIIVVTTLVVNALLFGIVAYMQHIVVDGWMDALLLRLDEIVFGKEASLTLEPFITPLLTEWMMFGYVAYIPLLPATAWLCFKHAGADAVLRYLFSLTFGYLVCYIAFMVFPVATQMHAIRDAYSVPLEGWFFTWCGEWIRANLHAPGQALPSPHCTAGTIMLVMSISYFRKLAWIYWVIILTLYASTVYCRYHYSWDVVTGIALGMLTVKYDHRIISLLNKAQSLIPRALLNRSEPT